MNAATARANRAAAFEKATREFALERSRAQQRYHSACPRPSKGLRVDPAAVKPALADDWLRGRLDGEMETARAKYSAAKATAHAAYLAAIAALPSDDGLEAGLEDIGEWEEGL